MENIMDISTTENLKTVRDSNQEILDYFYFVEPRWPNDTMGSLVNTPIYDPDN